MVVVLKNPPLAGYFVSSHFALNQSYFAPEASSFALAKSDGSGLRRKLRRNLLLDINGNPPEEGLWAGRNFLTKSFFVRRILPLALPSFEARLVERYWRTAKNDGVIFLESLILAQDERWRCALSMQVERSCP